MLTLRRPDEGQSAIGAIKHWLQDRIMGCGSSVRQASAPAPISRAEQQRFGPFSGGYDLLLIRMEALRLEPGEVRRIETAIFHDLAEACSSCEHKDQCERDVAYISAGKVVHDWEQYCPNTSILNAMVKLPWFGKQAREMRPDRYQGPASQEPEKREGARWESTPRGRPMGQRS